MKVISLGTNVGDGSSHDSSSDSDRVSPQFEGPNIEAEKGLPSVVSEETTKFVPQSGVCCLSRLLRKL